MPELNLDDLAIFVRVVERGGFASAARELKVPTSTISRAIGRLESTSGVTLLQRTTRAVRPTAEGRDLFANVAPAVTTLRGAAHALEPATRKARGRLRVSAPNDFAVNFLADVIVAFTERYPLVQLDFSLTNHHSNLVDEGFDVAVRAAVRLRDSSLVARKLGELQQRFYASPKYLQTQGAPRTLDDLKDHRCVVFRANELVRNWTTRGPSGETNTEVHGRIGGDDFSFVRAIVIAGGGIGLLPDINCVADEASGKLVRVLPELYARGATLYLVSPAMRNVPARVTAFRDFVIEAFETWSAQSR